MSFPQEELHEIASANMPTTPIKPTSTWVAILLHTKDDIEDIDKEDDFLWIKCHDRITIRTLRYQYFSRHPLEDFRLKQGNRYPKPFIMVSQLRKRELSGDNLVVLRALEPEDAEHEDQIMEDADLTLQIRKSTDQRKNMPRASGTTQTDAIVIGEDDDEVVILSKEGRSDVGTSDRSGTDGLREYTNGDHSMPSRTSTSSPPATEDVPHTTPAHEDWSMYDEADQQLLREAAEAANRSPSNSDESDLDPANGDTEYHNTNFDEQMTYEDDTRASIPAELLARLADASEHQRNRVTSSLWHTCETPDCKKQLHLKPWSRLGPESGILCTRCSVILLEVLGDGAAIGAMRRQRVDEFGVKQQRQRMGKIQNMDNDAPLDCDFPLSDGEDEDEGEGEEADVDQATEDFTNDEDEGHEDMQGLPDIYSPPPPASVHGYGPIHTSDSTTHLDQPNSSQPTPTVPHTSITRHHSPSPPREPTLRDYLNSTVPIALPSFSSHHSSTPAAPTTTTTNTATTTTNPTTPDSSHSDFTTSGLIDEDSYHARPPKLGRPLQKSPQQTDADMAMDLDAQVDEAVARATAFLERSESPGGGSLVGHDDVGEEGDSPGSEIVGGGRDEDSDDGDYVAGDGEEESENE